MISITKHVFFIICISFLLKGYSQKGPQDFQLCFNVEAETPINNQWMIYAQNQTRFINNPTQ